MMLRHCFGGVVLLGWVLALTSCFEIKEEVWIHPDTSGRVEVTCTVPTTALLMQGGKVGVERNIDAFLRDSGAFHKSSRSVEEIAGARTRIQVHLAFQSALDLARLRDSPATKRLPSAAGHWIGKISTRLNGRSLQLQHSRDLGMAVPVLKMMPPELLSGGVLETTLHLPEPVLRSNASDVRDFGRTLTWKTSLKDAVKKPILIDLTVNLPVPWMVIGVAASNIILLCAVVVWRWRRRQRTRNQ